MDDTMVTRDGHDAAPLSLHRNRSDISPDSITMNAWHQMTLEIVMKGLMEITVARVQSYIQRGRGGGR